MAEVFELRPHFEWRGLGFISQSALRLADSYADLDAERHYEVPGVQVADQGMSVRRGAEGRDQALGVQGVRNRLHAEHAIGTCMVSPEGACAAYYNYGRYAQARDGRVVSERALSERAKGAPRVRIASSASWRSSRPRARSARGSRTRRSRCPTARAARPPRR